MSEKLSKKNKILLSLTPIAAILLAFLILCFVTIGLYSSAFLGRVLTHWDSSISDCNYFPQRVIQKSDNPYRYAKNTDNSLSQIVVTHSNRQKSLTSFVKDTNTTAFIVLKNNEIIFEQYANGYDESSVNTSFSMAKSVVSLLVGIAIEKGYIDSVREPISNYISEFRNKEIGKTTIEDLLLMRSNISYEEKGFLWFGDDSLTYWHDDLRTLALTHTELTENYGGKFHYNNYHPLLLGIILERATGVSVSLFFQRELWQKLGAENDASWSLDSDKNGFEKMESGINFIATDFLKIGSLILHDGYWRGEQIVSKEWLKASTLCEFPLNANEYADTFLENKNIGYKYMWYSTPSAQEGSLDIVAWGKSDQILYISPSNNLVILRTGKTDGGVSDWVDALKNIVSEIR